MERSLKSRERLMRKLRKYSEETRIDGLIYICDSDDISATLRSVYGAGVLRQSLRVGHYSENFILFSDGIARRGERTPRVFNASLESVDLAHWMSSMRSISMLDRRDGNFKLQGAHPGHGGTA